MANFQMLGSDIIMQIASYLNIKSCLIFINISKEMQKHLQVKKVLKTLRKILERNFNNFNHILYEEFIEIEYSSKIYISTNLTVLVQLKDNYPDLIQLSSSKMGTQLVFNRFGEVTRVNMSEILEDNFKEILLLHSVNYMNHKKISEDIAKCQNEAKKIFNHIKIFPSFKLLKPHFAAGIVGNLDRLIVISKFIENVLDNAILTI